MFRKSSYSHGSGTGNCIEIDSFKKSSFSFANGNCIEAGFFRKASYSQGASNCAEVGEFRKSAFSWGEGNCAEVGEFRRASMCEMQGVLHCAEVGHGGSVIAVRDTKESHLGEDRTVLEFAPGAWGAFLSGLK